MQRSTITEWRRFRAWVGGWRNLGDVLSRQFWPLNGEALCAEARQRTGLLDFGDPPIETALSTLVNSLELQADLHPLGRFLMWVHLRGLLETRLRLTQVWRGQLEAMDTSLIERPVFITGMPRSGSTFLHELMSEDPENRAPRVWEVMFPIPTRSDARSSVDARIRKAEACLWWFRRLAPLADAVYPIRASTPHECVGIHSYTMLSQEFVITCRIPAYEAFLRDGNLRPAYAWQKRFLQYLQLSGPNRNWILKSPEHVYGLDHLLSVFPDAVVIQTHRNPLEVLRSSLQLNEVLEGVFAYPGDRAQTGIREARSLIESMESIRSFRKAHPEFAGRFIDVHYDELVSDPLEVVRQIYQRLNRHLAEPASERIQGLAARRSRYKGRHGSPTLADLGVDEVFESQRLAAWCSQCNVSDADFSSFPQQG
jgi:Sulfotransferase family